MEKQEVVSVLERLKAVKKKIKSLPDQFREDTYLECLLLEDILRDKFLRNRGRGLDDSK